MRDAAELAGDRRSPVLVLVTHHVEEIPPGLHPRCCSCATAGWSPRAPSTEVLTGDQLSATFDMPLEVDRHGEPLDRPAASARGAAAAPTQPAGAVRHGERESDVVGADVAGLGWQSALRGPGSSRSLSLRLRPARCSPAGRWSPRWPPRSAPVVSVAGGGLRRSLHRAAVRGPPAAAALEPAHRRGGDQRGGAGRAAGRGGVGGHPLGRPGEARPARSWSARTDATGLALPAGLHATCCGSTGPRRSSPGSRRAIAPPAG